MSKAAVGAVEVVMALALAFVVFGWVYAGCVPSDRGGCTGTTGVS